MRKRGLVVLSMTLFACTDRRSPPSTPMATATPTAPVVDARPDVAERPPLGPCDDAVADATKKKDMGWKPDPDVLDANGDGVDECVLRGCYGSGCDVVIYVREPSGVRLVGEMTSSIVSSPRCVGESPKGTFCRLEVGVHMIHGETQQTFWRYDGTKYVEDGHGKLSPR